MPAAERPTTHYNRTYTNRALIFRETPKKILVPPCWRISTRIVCCCKDRFLSTAASLLPNYEPSQLTLHQDYKDYYNGIHCIEAHWSLLQRNSSAAAEPLQVYHNISPNNRSAPAPRAPKCTRSDRHTVKYRHRTGTAGVVTLNPAPRPRQQVNSPTSKCTVHRSTDPSVTICCLTAVYIQYPCTLRAASPTAHTSQIEQKPRIYRLSAS